MFQKEFYYNYLKKRQSILTLISLAIKRRKKLLILQWIIRKILKEKNKKRSIRSCRRFCRNTGWWELVWTQYDDKRFKETFHISRNTFKYILSEIRVNIERQQPISSEEPISSEMHLAICLYELSRGDYNYTISEVTEVGESTVICIVNEVFQAIVENLWAKFVSNLFPKNQGDFSNAMGEMYPEWQFPFAFSAIDGSHLPMKYPPGGPEAMKQYHNFRNFCSIILPAVVDTKYRFIWAGVGAPGNS